MRFDDVVMRKNTANYIYKRLEEPVQKESGKLKQWQADFPTLMSDEFLRCFKNIFSVTNNSKLRSMQYRILQRALVFNDKLYRWGDA